MKALYICKDLLHVICNEKILYGQVHSVFTNACNIEFNDDFLITLLSKGKKMAPMSVIIDNSEIVSFQNLHISQGLDLHMDKGGIYSVEKGIYIGFEGAEMRTSELTLKASSCSQAQLLENIAIMELGLCKYGKLYGIGPLINMLGDYFPDLDLFLHSPYVIARSFEFIKVRFRNFVEAVTLMDVKGVAQAAGKVIGFGAGLTPAADDFIVGLMASIISLGNYYGLSSKAILHFNSEIIRLGINKTTRVSAEMLKHASKGNVNEAVGELINSIVYQQDSKAINSALISTIAFGETSGTDTALGIYVGCKIMINSKYRRVWVNEHMCGYKKEYLL